MPRPFTRAQALENAAFLRALRRTGNAREAARSLGRHRAMFTKRRASHPAFAAAWDAAIAFADAALASAAPASDAAPQVVRTRGGRRQLRRPTAGLLTSDVEQTFLSALSATANVRLSAAAAGFSHSAFYARRKASPAFAREMRLALERGVERIEETLLSGFQPDSYEDDAWRHNEPPPIPAMTVDQALQLLRLHNRTVHLQAEPDHIRRRRGESREAHSFRLGAMYEAKQARAREDFAVAEAARRRSGEPCIADMLSRPPPALDQVTGWSKAVPATLPDDTDDDWWEDDPGEAPDDSPGA